MKANIQRKAKTILPYMENRLPKTTLAVDSLNNCRLFYFLVHPFSGGHARSGLEGTEEGALAGKTSVAVNL